MKRTPAILIALLLAASCTKPVADLAEDVIGISMPTDTKVHLEGLKTCWDKGDAVTVFYRSDKAENWTFKGETGDVSGQLVHPCAYRPCTREDIVALYPYDAGAVIAENTIHTSIPSLQQYRASSYGTAVLAARSTSDMLELKYCTALVELEYRGPADISDIVLSASGSEPMSGSCVISLEGERPSLTCTGSSSVTLKCDASVAGSQTGTFFFSVAPGIYDNGFTFTVNFADGGSQTITISESVSLTAGHIYTVEAVSPAVPSDMKEIHLVFSDGKTAKNPFNAKVTYKHSVVEIGPFYYQIADETYPFYMLCQNEDSDFRVTGGGGLYIGGTEGDYITFPAIERFRLDKISVSLHKKSDFHITPTDSPSTTIATCSYTEAGDYRIIDLSGTEAGKSYRMWLDSKSCFRSIILYYKK